MCWVKQRKSSAQIASEMEAWLGPQAYLEMIGSWADRAPRYPGGSLAQFELDNPGYSVGPRGVYRSGPRPGPSVDPRSDRADKIRIGGVTLSLPDVCGFPQGANVSPFLSICLLNLLKLPSNCNIIMYADDGLIYSNTRFTEESIVGSFEALGVEVSREKSSWVKVSSKWRSPLKFLGLRYDGVSDTLHAATRNGAMLKYDKQDLVKALEQGEVLVPYPAEHKSEVPFDSYGLMDGLGGFISCSSLEDARLKLSALMASSNSVTWRIIRVSPEGLIISEDVASCNS